MSKIRVGVMRGGPSSEYDISLISGQAVLENLPEKYQPIDILIDKTGVWHIDGLPQSIDQALKKVDLIFNAMHGEYGEDGKVQQLLEPHGVPFTGSKALGSALAFHKEKAKRIFKQYGLKTAHHRTLKVKPEDDIEAIALDLFRTFPMPLVIKPVAAGSSVGVHMAKNFPEIIAGLKKTSEKFSDILVEECIKGREATVGVVEHFRNQPLYALPVIEIIPPKESSFFDREVKYNGTTEEICPGNFSLEEKTELERMAKIAHQALGLRHYSRSDFIVSPRRGIFILETNTLPGMTPESLMPKPVKAVGSSFPEFLDHLLTLARENK